MPHPSLLFRWLAIAYILGVGAGSVGRPPDWLWIVLGILGMLIAIRSPRPIWLCLAIAAAGAILGVWQIGATLSHRAASQVPGCCGQKVTIQGTITAEPATGIDHQTIVVLPLPTSDWPHPAKLQVRLPLGQTLNYGDMITITCAPSLPEPTEDFAFDKYLMLSNIRATCLAPRVTITGRQTNLVAMRLIFQAKHWTAERLQQALPEPQVALMAGLLIGSRSSLPESVSNDFRLSGVSHIVAISGYNITIIAVMIFAGTCRYIGRRRSFWLVVGVLIVFTIMTGAQASVIRATLMGILALTAKQVGRIGAVGSIWLLAGCIMVAANPMVLVFDAGFQLSFLATAGLIWLSPTVSRGVRWMPQALGLRDSLGSTLSATLLTLPVMLGNFRQVSIIAPVVNMLVLPVIPAIMGVGTIIIGAAAVSPAFSQVIGWFAWLGLTYILSVTHWFGSLPYASMAIAKVHIKLLIGMYVIIMGWWFGRRTIIHQLKIWLKK